MLFKGCIKVFPLPEIKLKKESLYNEMEVFLKPKHPATNTQSELLVPK